MHDTFSRYFGIVIAFVLPGLLGMYALSFFSPVLRAWFDVAAKQDSSVGGFLFVLLGSLGVGLFISGVRWLLLDRFFPTPPRLDHQRRNTETEHVYQDIRAQHYHFYQFYSNTFCALILLFVAWATVTQPPTKRVIGLLIALLIASVVLLLSARDAIKKYDNKVTSLLRRAKESA